MINLDAKTKWNKIFRVETGKKKTLKNNKNKINNN